MVQLSEREQNQFLSWALEKAARGRRRPAWLPVERKRR
jgi:hypothetical protein